MFHDRFLHRLATGVFRPYDLVRDGAILHQRPPIAFVGQASTNGSAIDYSGAAIRANDALQRASGSGTQTPPSLPAGYAELWAAWSVPSPASYSIGIQKRARGDAAETDPINMAGRHRLVVHRNARVKAGSVSVLSSDTAVTTASVPAKDPDNDAGEWAVGFLWCRSSQTSGQLQAFVPGDCFVRGSNFGGANSTIAFDDGGTGDGWGQIDQTVASTLWFGASWILEPA